MIAFPYISLVIIFFIRYYTSNCTPLYRKSEKLFIYFILFVFFGFRGYIFTDCFEYATFFEGVPNIKEIINSHYLKYAFWEPGYVCYCGILKLFIHKFYYFQIIDTTLDLILLYKSLEYFESNRSLNIIVFLAMSGMIAFIDLFRNIKAILLFFYALRYVDEKKLIRFYLLCFLAFLFHKSSVFYFACYPLLRQPLTKRKYLVICIISIIIALFSKTFILVLNSRIWGYFPPKIQDSISFYVLSNNPYTVGRFITFGVIEKLLTCGLIYFNFDKLFISKKYKLLIKVFCIYFSSYFICFGFNEISNRISMLFIFSYWCLIPEIIKKQTKKNQYFYTICLLAYCVLKVGLYKHPVQKYENWLFNASTFSERLEIKNQYY